MVPAARFTKLALVGALTFLFGCSQPGGADGVRPPEGTPAGLLVAAGTNHVHTYDLRAGGPWQKRFEYDAASAAVAVDEPRRELIQASTTGSEFVTVTVYDVDDGNVSGATVVTFTAEERGSGTLKPAISSDGSALVYESQGSVWLTELAYEAGTLVGASVPRRLTTGPEPSHGAALSPTGSHMAFTVGGAHLASTYVAATPPVEPILIHRNGEAGAEYLLQPRTLIDYVLAWLE